MPQELKDFLVEFNNKEFIGILNKQDSKLLIFNLMFL